jgi:membrane-bound lytic murein transglycosylase B
MGPMQFLPSTFAAYAVDGDGDGVTDIWNPADAIYSAARYLCANGAGAGPRALYNAIYRYNPADWYVLMVMRVAGELATRFGEPVPVAEAP